MTSDFERTRRREARPSARRPPTLLVLPGWNDDGKRQFEWLRDELARDGWVCARAELPDASWSAIERAAHTRDDGLRRVRRDLLELSEAAGSGGPTAVLGFSYGGYLAAILSGMHPPSLLVLRSPALYPDEDWHVPKEDLDKRELDEYRRRYHAPPANRALAACAAFSGHALLVSSELDQVVPAPVVESFAAALGSAASLSRHALRGADHELSDPKWEREYHAVATSWLRARATDL